MTNLIKLSDSQANDFDFNQITDKVQRESAISICTEREAIYADLWDQAKGIVKQNTVNLAETIYLLKENLDHGNFTTVCQGRYNLDRNKQAALSQVGKAIASGTESDIAIEMLSEMEPRAAQQYLKSDSQTKSHQVVSYASTGQVPTRNNYAELAYQKKQLEHNKEQIAMNAFSDCLENSTVLDTYTDDEGFTQVNTEVISNVNPEIVEVDVLTDIQQQLHDYLRVNFRSLNERQMNTLRVIHDTIENYSLGKIK